MFWTVHSSRLSLDWARLLISLSLLSPNLDSAVKAPSSLERPVMWDIYKVDASPSCGPTCGLEHGGGSWLSEGYLPVLQLREQRLKCWAGWLAFWGQADSAWSTGSNRYNSNVRSKAMYRSTLFRRPAFHVQRFM